MDERSEIVTSIDVTPGNRPDDKSARQVVENATVKPDRLMGDTAYGTLEARASMNDQEIKVVAPLPMGSKKRDKFGKHDFTIDLANKTCQCPAGEFASKTRAKDNQVTAYVFSKQTCNKCELRDQCT